MRYTHLCNSHMTRRAVLALLAALASPALGAAERPTESDDPLGSRVVAARDAFDAVVASHATYRRALDAVAPTYDAAADPGPPFDVFYHLELLHRAAAAGLREARHVWDDVAAPA